MSKTAAIGAVLLIVVGAFVAGRYTGRSRQLSEHAGTRRVLYYVDPMHPAYRSDKPGIAPDCGMPLEPVYAEDGNHASPSATLAQVPPGIVAIDGATQELIGIRTATVERSGGPKVIRLV